MNNPDVDSINALFDLTFAIGALVFIAMNFLGNTLSLLSGSISFGLTRRSRATVDGLRRRVAVGPQIDDITAEQRETIRTSDETELIRAEAEAEAAKKRWEGEFNRLGLLCRWLGALGGLFFAILAVMT